MAPIDWNGSHIIYMNFIRPFFYKHKPMMDELDEKITEVIANVKMEGKANTERGEKKGNEQGGLTEVYKINLAEFLIPVRAEVSLPDVETQYQQSKAYVELNKRLEVELKELALRSEELKKAGEQLDLSISEIKDKHFQNQANDKE
ncbi:hypothetical protein chiPu_0009621 [Chiloscyllium punctatum]|uniref:Uncharacterized protein n=1 Tax=Chiloscyllium punctatum TaxID=137246 RepID=A0A401SLA2_CHIPU|nr:hypothetical protein [Chiloscyllium punctatum]